jgi:hypothetical protein
MGRNDRRQQAAGRRQAAARMSRIAPYIGPDGMARERERAAYRVALVTEGDRLFIGFLPDGDGLTCLEYAPVFSMALRPGTDKQEARDFGLWLAENLEGLDAVYAPDREPPPTYPNVVTLRAA